MNLLGGLCPDVTKVTVVEAKERDHPKRKPNPPDHLPELLRYDNGGHDGHSRYRSAQFLQIYGEAVIIPTHGRWCATIGRLVYLTKQEKFDALIEDIRDCQERNQPEVRHGFYRYLRVRFRIAG